MALSETFLVDLGSRFLPASLNGRAERFLGLGDKLISGRGERAASLRMAGFAFSVRIASAAIGFFSQVVLARMLGEFEYGIFAFVFVFSLIGGGLTCMGMQTAALKFVSTYRTARDLDRLRGIIYGSRILALGISASVAALCGLGLWLSQGSVADYYIAPLALALLLLPLLAISEVQDLLGRAFDRPDVAFLPTFIVRPTLLLGFMVFAVSMGFSGDAQLGIACAILSVFLAVVWQWHRLRAHLKKTVPAGARIMEPLHWTKVAFPIFLVGGFFNLMTNVDVLILGWFSEPDRVAIYFAAAKILALVHFVPFAIKAAVQHRFASFHEAGQLDELARFTRETVRWGFLPVVALGLFIGATSPWILQLFGESYTEASGFLWLLIGGLIIRSLVGPAESLLTMVGQERACAAAYGLTLLVNVVLNLLLIPQFGLWGAAMATATSMVVEALALWLVVKRRLGFSVFVI